MGSIVQSWSHASWSRYWQVVPGHKVLDSSEGQRARDALHIYNTECACNLYCPCCMLSRLPFKQLTPSDAMQAFDMQPQYGRDLAETAPRLADNVQAVCETCHRAAEELKANSSSVSMNGLAGTCHMLSLACAEMQQMESSCPYDLTEGSLCC